MKKIVNIAFIIIFFLILTIPLLTSDFKGGAVSELEKRVLSPFPKLVNENGNIQLSEVKKLDQWISDNVGFRETCVDLYTKLMVKGLNVSSSDRVMSGKSGWFFYTPDNNIEIGLGKLLLDESSLKAIADKQQRISDYYKKKGIDYVLVITPSKASIYPEYVLGGNEVQYTMSDQLKEYLEQNTDVRVAAIKDDMIAAKNDGKLFLKTDTHWTELGAYKAYLSIMEKLAAFGITDSSPVSADFNSEIGSRTGEFGMMLGNYNILGEEEFAKAVFDRHSVQITDGGKYDHLAKMQQNINSNYPAVVLENENADGKNLLIYGDSQWELFRNMPLYFAESFSNVVSMRADNLYSEIDFNAKPDIILFACSERFLNTKLMADVPSFINDPVTDTSEILLDDVRSLENSPDNLWIDYCNNVPQLEEQLLITDPSSSDIYTITGWAGDLIQGCAFGGLYLQVGDEIFKCNYGEERSIVAEVYQNENLRYTGFSVSVPAESFTGAEEIRFIELSSDRSYRYEDVIYRVREDNIGTDELMNYPVHSLEASPNNIWVDYCNGIVQSEERLFHIAADGADTITLKGWSADLINGVPFSSLYVKVGDELFKCCYGGERSIVAEVYQNEALRYSGFSVRISADRLMGTDHIEFIGVGSDKSFRYDMSYNIQHDIPQQQTQPSESMSDSNQPEKFSKMDIISTAFSAAFILALGVCTAIFIGMPKKR